MATLDQIAHEKYVKERGPDRILVTAEGEAKSPRRAPEAWQRVMKGGVVLVRSDGWSLGATVDLATEAYDTWNGAWIGFIPLPGEWQPIHQWHSWIGNLVARASGNSRDGVVF